MAKSREDRVAELEAENQRLRRAEWRFRLQFEHAPIPQVMSDSTGNFIDANAAATVLLGYTREELLSRSFDDVTVSADAEESELSQTQVVSGLHPYVQFETQYVCKGGEVIDCKTTVFPVKDAESRYLYTMAYIEDITERKQRDETMQTLAHDLKNPLTNIASAVGMLVETCNDEENQRIHNIVQQSVNNMFTLINNLLELSRLETRRQVNPEPVEVNPFLKDMVEGFKLAAKDKNVTLAFTPLQPDTTLMLDPNLMRQAIENLLSNALKYTPAGGRVMLDGIVTADEVILKLSDNGLGIPDDELPYLFERFYRVSTREHRAVDGTGLGLAIIKAIVTQHDGRIWVESTLGEGSTFYMALPLPED